MHATYRGDGYDHGNGLGDSHPYGVATRTYGTGHDYGSVDGGGWGFGCGLSDGRGDSWNDRMGRERMIQGPDMLDCVVTVQQFDGVRACSRD